MPRKKPRFSSDVQAAVCLWFAAARGRLEALKQELEQVLERANVDGSPVAALFDVDELRSLRNALSDVSNQFGGCAPRLAPPCGAELPDGLD